MAYHWDGVASLPSFIWIQPARALRVQVLAVPPAFFPARLLCASLVCSIIFSAWALAPLVSLHIMAWFSETSVDVASIDEPRAFLLTHGHTT